MLPLYSIYVYKNQPFIYFAKVKGKTNNYINNNYVNNLRKGDLPSKPPNNWNKKRRILTTYIINIMSFVLPMASIYHMTHTVSQAVWGNLVMAQSYAVMLAVLVEYGFMFSASRALMTTNSDIERSSVITEVISAKLLLSLFAAIITFIISLTTQLIDPASFIMALIYAISLGHSQIWYFQMTEKLNLFLLLDFISKLLGTLGIFFFIFSNDQACIYLIMLSLSALLSSVVGYFLMYRDVPFILPRLDLAVSGLRSGFSGFSFRFLVSAYANFSTIIVGLSISPSMAASYFNAEKTLSIFRFFTMPINQLVYPKLSRLSQEESLKTIMTAYKIALLLTGFLTLIAAVLYIFMPWLIRIIFGEGYEQTVFIVRGMLTAVPFIAMGAVIGGPYMGATDQLTSLNQIILIASIAGIAYILLTPQLSWTYIAYTVLFVESIVVVLLMYKQLNTSHIKMPFRLRRK